MLKDKYFAFYVTAVVLGVAVMVATSIIANDPLVWAGFALALIIPSICLLILWHHLRLPANVQRSEDNAAKGFSIPAATVCIKVYTRTNEFEKTQDGLRILLSESLCLKVFLPKKQDAVGNNDLGAGGSLSAT